MESVEIILDGKKIIIETGKLAKQADGAVTVRLGDSMILATVVAAKSLKEGIDFFPLTVEYRERSAAAGRFPGGYVKREGRPKEKEILASRLVDRPLRPLFPDNFLYEVQVIIQVLSADGENDPDMLAIIGASAALSISGIPFSGPLGAVRVGKIDGEYLVNMTYAQMPQSELELVVAGTEKAIIMIEGASREVSEEVMLEALNFAHDRIKIIARGIAKLKEKINKEPMTYTPLEVDATLLSRMKELTEKALSSAIHIKGKNERDNKISEIKAQALAKITEEFPETASQLIDQAFYMINKKLVRDEVLKGKRSDGRGIRDIRSITCEVGLLPQTHGSALFTRGETQALVCATLGGERDVQRYETLLGDESKKFMLFYNFPPFSVGEVKRMASPGRREIGHGALAERSLLAVLPKAEDFPYTIGLISDILESNGSSSMASVCGGTLALMDCGVPITAPVAGIAMGLILENGKATILSDILGSEDALGDMDFKVAGTTKGITGFQLDIKIEGITPEIMKQALAQAKEGRLHILNIMRQALEAPRETVAAHAPKIFTLRINPDKIGALIGPGGKNIKKIIEETGCDINIEDDGKVSIVAPNQEQADLAIKSVDALTKDVEVGELYEGVVKNVVDFGAFVEILPGKEGLVHISKLANERVNQVSDVCKVGDRMKVKVMQIDERGRINLSRKDALEVE